MEENRDVEVMPQRIPCAVCQHDIPLSEAVVPEASDNAAYFCSRDCYYAWLTRAAALYTSLR